MTLAKAGYYSGDPEQVLNAPVGMVMAALEYEKFQADYTSAFKMLNNKDGK